MGFNLGAGLAEMGKSIAQTAGDAAINMQRAELERQRIELADSLQGARESRARRETSLINEAAAEKERNWRSVEADKREAAEQSRFETREKNETARTAITNNRMLALHDLSERAADGRLEKQLAAAKAEATQRAKDKAEERIIESAIKSSQRPVEMPYITAAGEKASRTVMVTDPVAVAAKLRDTGHPDLANPFDPKPVKQAPKAEAVARPPALAGLPGKLQFNPSLKQYRDDKGNLYDANGKPIGK